MRTSYTHDGKQVAVGEISSLPGCSQVAVFHSAFVLPQHRDNGVGHKAHVARLEAAQDALYNYALCTVDAENATQIAILNREGWIQLDWFISDKTGHRVWIYGRGL